jgi:GrpB-like predicted nucleotidyltransferase (UPF0157 family)
MTDTRHITAASSAYSRPSHFGSEIAVSRQSTQAPADAPGLRQSDPRWADLFREEQQAIRRRLGRTDVAVEHVGSSSVTGLVGRAEIDILVGVRRATQVPQCIRALQLLNFGLVSQSHSGNEAWAYLTKAGAVEIEVLVVQYLGSLWRRHLALREYLRADPARAASYGRLKVQWAAKYGAGTTSYKEAKRRYWAAIATP